jgi:hypothetical protein
MTMAKYGVSARHGELMKELDDVQRLLDAARGALTKTAGLDGDIAMLEQRAQAIKHALNEQ